MRIRIGLAVKRNGFKTTFAPDLIVYAHDHRRLRRGTWKKTLHSLVRCMLLYLNCMPPRLRSQDWVTGINKTVDKMRRTRICLWK
jgi:hypothetical protein